MCRYALTASVRTFTLQLQRLQGHLDCRVDSIPTPLSRICRIRIISVHFLGAAGELLRVLFLDRAGHISAEPHYVPRDEALILASNRQRVLGAQGRVQVL